MKYICQICGYVYDDAKEKVPFTALPDTWKCPLCGAAKSDFKAETVAEDTKVPVYTQTNVAIGDIKKLSVGQLAALCSNLARGCEKQYNSEAQGLFKQLADYFSATVPAEENATVKELADLLQSDIDGYKGLRAVADDNGDRGTARVCVWGEKVTRMLSSLVGRYLKEGESVAKDTNIWVCTVCGFVYVGDNAPELCPVCKVPAWKFDKIEGRA